MIREAVSAVARNGAIGGVINRAPIARGVVRRIVAGNGLDEVMGIASRLADEGRWVSLEREKPSIESDAEADAVLSEYRELVDRVAAEGLAESCEVVILPESLGTADGSITDSALARLESLCDHGMAAGVEVTVGTGPARDVDRTLSCAEAMFDRGASVGVTLQAAMRRSEADCARFAAHRIRLVKGTNRTGGELTYAQPAEIDKAYVRCARLLLRGSGEPSFATHDARLIEIVEALAARLGRTPQTYEFTLYLGRLEGTQDRLAAAGGRVRIYVPYGPGWIDRLMAGLAEQPNTITAALRSLLPGAPT